MARYVSYLEGRMAQHVSYGQFQGFAQLDCKAQDTWQSASPAAKTYVLLRGSLVGPGDNARKEYQGKCLMGARLLARIGEFSKHQQGRPRQWCQNTSLGNHFAWPDWLDHEVFQNGQLYLPANAFQAVVQQAQHVIWTKRLAHQARSS